jgi:hypothetical protein
LTDIVQKGEQVPKSYVLSALRVFGQEQILKLSRIVNSSTSIFKKVAGDELVAWNNAPEESTSDPLKSELSDNVLPFRPAKNDVPESVELPSESKESSDFSSSDFIMWQRELSRGTGNSQQKIEAVKGYSKATEMYVVKTPTIEGKDKIRFASTNGVLVNKKQA